MWERWNLTKAYVRLTGRDQWRSCLSLRFASLDSVEGRMVFSLLLWIELDIYLSIDLDVVVFSIVARDTRTINTRENNPRSTAFFAQEQFITSLAACKWRTTLIDILSWINEKKVSGNCARRSKRVSPVIDNWEVLAALKSDHEDPLPKHKHQHFASVYRSIHCRWRWRREKAIRHWGEPNRSWRTNQSINRLSLCFSVVHSATKLRLCSFFLSLASYSDFDVGENQNDTKSAGLSSLKIIL